MGSATVAAVEAAAPGTAATRIDYAEIDYSIHLPEPTDYTVNLRTLTRWTNPFEAGCTTTTTNTAKSRSRSAPPRSFSHESVPFDEPPSPARQSKTLGKLAPKETTTTTTTKRSSSLGPLSKMKRKKTKQKKKPLATTDTPSCSDQQQATDEADFHASILTEATAPLTPPASLHSLGLSPSSNRQRLSKKGLVTRTSTTTTTTTSGNDTPKTAKKKKLKKKKKVLAAAVAEAESDTHDTVVGYLPLTDDDDDTPVSVNPLASNKETTPSSADVADKDFGKDNGNSVSITPTIETPPKHAIQDPPPQHSPTSPPLIQEAEGPLAHSTTLPETATADQASPANETQTIATDTPTALPQEANAVAASMKEGMPRGVSGSIQDSNVQDDKAIDNHDDSAIEATTTAVISTREMSRTLNEECALGLQFSPCVDKENVDDRLDDVVQNNTTAETASPPPPPPPMDPPALDEEAPPTPKPTTTTARRGRSSTRSSSIATPKSEKKRKKKKKKSITSKGNNNTNNTENKPNNSAATKSPPPPPAGLPLTEEDTLPLLPKSPRIATKSSSGSGTPKSEKKKKKKKKSIVTADANDQAISALPLLETTPLLNDTDISNLVDNNKSKVEATTHPLATPVETIASPSTPKKGKKKKAKKKKSIATDTTTQEIADRKARSLSPTKKKKKSMTTVDLESNQRKGRSLSPGKKSKKKNLKLDTAEINNDKRKTRSMSPKKKKKKSTVPESGYVKVDSSADPTASAQDTLPTGQTETSMDLGTLESAPPSTAELGEAIIALPQIGNLSKQVPESPPQEMPAAQENTLSPALALSSTEDGMTSTGDVVTQSLEVPTVAVENINDDVDELHIMPVEESPPPEEAVSKPCAASVAATLGTNEFDAHDDSGNHSGTPTIEISNTTEAPLPVSTTEEPTALPSPASAVPEAVPAPVDKMDDKADEIEDVIPQQAQSAVEIFTSSPLGNSGKASESHENGEDNDGSRENVPTTGSTDDSKEEDSLLSSPPSNHASTALSSPSSATPEISDTPDGNVVLTSVEANSESIANASNMPTLGDDEVSPQSPSFTRESRTRIILSLSSSSGSSHKSIDYKKDLTPTRRTSNRGFLASPVENSERGDSQKQTTATTNKGAVFERRRSNASMDDDIYDDDDDDEDATMCSTISHEGSNTDDTDPARNKSPQNDKKADLRRNLSGILISKSGPPQLLRTKSAPTTPVGSSHRNDSGSEEVRRLSSSMRQLRESMRNSRRSLFSQDDRADDREAAQKVREIHNEVQRALKKHEFPPPAPSSIAPPDSISSPPPVTSPRTRTPRRGKKKKAASLSAALDTLRDDNDLGDTQDGDNKETHYDLESHLSPSSTISSLTGNSMIRETPTITIATLEETEYDGEDYEDYNTPIETTSIEDDTHAHVADDDTATTRDNNDLDDDIEDEEKRQDREMRRYLRKFIDDVTEQALNAYLLGT